jgi:nitrogen-specific signal transduction histidine kinase
VLSEIGTLLSASVSKHVKLRLELQPALPRVVMDATQVRQIVMNLVINASEAIGAHEGLVTVSTGVMHASRSLLDEALLPPGSG